MIDLLYRLNMMGEKQFFESNNLIDGLVVPAHLLAFYHGSLPSFLSDINLPFIIDPMTYVWNIDRNYVLNESELKKSYKKYVDFLNNNIASLLGFSRITDNHFSEEDLFTFSNSILAFQYTLCGHSSNPRLRSLRRIRKRIRGADEREIRPFGLIPPYFFFSSMSQRAYELTRICAENALETEFSNLTNIIPCLCMGQEILFNDTFRENLISDFSEYGSVFLWIDDFDERGVSVQALQNYRELVTKFNENDVSVFNMYASFYSLLMENFGLEKISSGIAISHRKRVTSSATGGGMPLRYYEPSLKMEILNFSAFRIYSRHPELFVCNCPICQPYSSRVNTNQTVSEREEILAPLFVDEHDQWGNVIRKAEMSWKNTRYHFLHVKKNEQLAASSTELIDLITVLRNDYSSLSRLDPTFYNIRSVEHLKRWYESF